MSFNTAGEALFSLKINSIYIGRIAGKVNRPSWVRDFKYLDNICLLHIGHVVHRMRGCCKRIVDGNLSETSYRELMTQERIASSIFAEGLTR